MTKTEPKYRKGQIVHVRMRVLSDGPDFEGEVHCETMDGATGIFVLQADIVSAEPGPLKIGDRVRNTNWSNPAFTAEIIAIYGDYVLLRLPAGDCHEFSLTDLVRA